jgi:hypothetical protein
MDLARTPLFCQLLIDVFRFFHHMPEERIKVYDKIIELLLSDHPAARIQAAGLPVPPDTPKIDDMREMLMRLALHIQVNGGAGVISTEDCKNLLCDFLIDDINGPGYSTYDARHQAKTIIDYAQTGLGLVVERAPDELGFFHLTVQEYLAAQAMVRKEEQEQLDWLTSVWNQSRWHEVVLCWFSMMGAEQGKVITQRAIDHLKRMTTSPFAKLQLLLLLTELAAGDHGLSPREARTIIKESADQIEITPFPELRQELARYITRGLRSPSVAGQCKERLADWIPARSEWNIASLLKVLGNWHMSEDLLHTLKMALYDENCTSRWAAAESLATAFASNATVGEHLAMVAAKWPDTCVRAAALHGLGKGWPQHEALNNLADVAQCSTDNDLALTGIALRVQNHRHDTNDRQKIWNMFFHDNVSFGLQDFCYSILLQGWNNDKKIKALAINALSDRKQGGVFVEERIISYLAASWPDDEEVGKCITNWFARSTHHLEFIHKQEVWKNLFQGFRGNKVLSSALRHALSVNYLKHSTIYWGPNTKWGYCVIGDDTAKREVINAYSSVTGDINKMWVVSTLMEAWPNDSDVIEMLIRESHRPPQEVAFLSPWIDSFVQDPSVRQAWLLEALRKSDRGIVSKPVHRLLKEFQDDECLELVLNILKKDIWYYDKISIQNQLIMKFPHVPEIRQLAESSFSEIDGPSLESIATGYQTDSFMRDRILRAARPAKTNVRNEIFRVFREYSIPKNSGLQLTEDIWAEETGAIRSAGVIARCIVVSQDPELKAPLLMKLCSEIKSFGTYYEMRRRAAFAGLLKLGEYAACFEAIAKESTPTLHWLANYNNDDIITIRTLFEHWDKLQEALQTLSLTFEIPWGELIYNGTAREALSNSVARTQIIDYLKTMKIQDRSSASLTLMAELMPNSMELRACLIECINNSTWNNNSFEAQRIYAKQFGGDEQALMELQQCWKKPDMPPLAPKIYPPFLYALTIGWPDSEVIRPYLELQALPSGFPLIEALALCGINGNENHAVACIDRMIEITIQDGRALPDIYPQILRDWARTRKAETILRRLIDDRDPSRKITAIRLLDSIGKLTNEDRIVLVRLFDAIQEDTYKDRTDGVDLMNGTVTTLPQAIFRVLIQN